MDEHIRELFDQAQKFYEADGFLDPEFKRRSGIIFEMEDEIEKWYGEEAKQFLFSYLLAQVNLLEFVCLHYFHQGYLAAQAESRKDKGE